MAPKKKTVIVRRRITRAASQQCSTVAAESGTPTIEDSKSPKKSIEEVERTTVSHEPISEIPSSSSAQQEDVCPTKETSDRIIQLKRRTLDVDTGSINEVVPENSKCEASAERNSNSSVEFKALDVANYSRPKAVQDDPNFGASVEQSQNSEIVQYDAGKKEGGEKKRLVKKKVVKVVKRLVKRKVPKRVEKSGIEFSNNQSANILAGNSENVEVQDIGSRNSDQNEDIAKSNVISGGSNERCERSEGVQTAEMKMRGENSVETAERNENLGNIEDDARDNHGNVVAKILDSVSGEVERKGKTEADVGRGAARGDEVVSDGNKNGNIIERCDGCCEDTIDKMSIDSSLNENSECNNKVKVVGGTAEGKVGEERRELNPEGYKDGCGMIFSGELEVLERRKRRKTEIYIGGLDIDTKEEDIRKVFEQVGQVVEVRLIKSDNKGKSKCFAFVRYAAADDARRALEKYKKVEICGRECSAAQVEGNDTLYLGNIDRKWKSEDVVKLLHEVGVDKIDRVNIITDPKNSRCNRGFAFLELDTCKDAQNAYRILQKKDMLGKLQNVRVEWAEPLDEPDEAEMQKVKSVYVEYIPSSWDEGKLKGYFEKFGEINNLVYARSLPSSKRKDFAFVSYTTRDAALTCINSLNCETLSNNGSKVNLKVSLAKPQNKGKSNKKVSNPVKQKPSPGVPGVLPIEARSAGISIRSNHEDKQRDRRSTNAELVQLLREQASWGQPSRNLRTGSPTFYASLSGQKRPFTGVQDDPIYSDPRVHGLRQLDTNAVASGRPPSHISRLTSVPNHEHQTAGYPPGYADDFRREKDPYYRRKGGLPHKYW